LSQAVLKVKNKETFVLNYSKILKAFTPIIPHFAFECLDSLNVQDKINWPNIDQKFLRKEIFNIVIQINGKKRCIKTFEKEISEKDLLSNLKTDEKILKFLNNRPIKKNIYIKNKLINLII
jgi:leucyl-tRNA synthetase